MKAWHVLVGIVGFLVLIPLIWMGTYNSIITLDEEVEQTWAQVENVYQRRADLVPNLVATVQGYAAHEKGVFTEVTAARSKVGSITVNAGELASNPDLQQKFLAAQKELTGALSRLIAVAENYPQLKASDNFLALQNQLEGTENRITNERRRNQEAVQAYNVRIKKFPTSMIANAHGFGSRQYFEADEGADQAPQVKFN